jgi:hypothetical protein
MQFSFTIPKDKEAYIAYRASRLGSATTPTAYVRMIIDHWFQAGTPALSEGDRGAQQPPKQLTEKMVAYGPEGPVLGTRAAQESDVQR